jgi:hypothetical protein
MVAGDAEPTAVDFRGFGKRGKSRPVPHEDIL